MVFSLSRSSSSKDLRREYVQESQSQLPMPQVKSSSKFNAFTSAFGLKSKKSPSLAIQPPPSSMSSNVVTFSDATRTTSKSASSTRSRVDSIEPRTPVDSQRDIRHSLLTLADDPFAGRPMIAVPIPHLPSDPNRLSAYSNPSITDFVQKKGAEPSTFNRISYASSSSTSNNHAFDISPVTPPLPSSSKTRMEFRELHKKRSVGSIQIQRSEAPLQRQTSLVPTSDSRARPGSSSVTGHDSHSMQVINGPERPKLRARGMTDSSASRHAGFFVEERQVLRKIPQKSPTSSNPYPSSEKSFQGRPTSPRVVIRQASITQFQGPPSAPPTQRLPPPPPLQRVPDSSQRQSRPSSSRHVESPSSSMSFSSAISLTNEMFANPPFAYSDDDRRRSGRSLFSQNAEDELEISMFEHESGTVPSSPRTLKKPLSQQSLSRRTHASPPTVPKPPEDSPPVKTFRKQRSFHHPRLPVPPAPLPPPAPPPAAPPMPSSSTMTFPSTGEATQVSTLERRRTSTTSSSGRKRLFSYSSQHRPSTAQPLSSPTLADEDTFSLFSLRSEAESHIMPYQAWSPSTTKSGSTSFWDEGSNNHPPTSPERSNIEYTPQAIMSRAELAKLEASVDTSPLPITRSRGFSILSASTMVSEAENDSEVISLNLSPPPPPHRLSNKPQSARLSTSSSKKSPIFLSLRPQTSPQSVSSGQDEREESHSFSIPAVTKSAKVSPDGIGLPPPPRKQRSTLVSELPPEKPRGAPSTQKSGPTRISAVGKASHRRSIMRKSSFLDIDDETDRDTDHDPVDARMNGSFLDLARESFDTTRSDC